MLLSFMKAFIKREAPNQIVPVVIIPNEYDSPTASDIPMRNPSIVKAHCQVEDFGGNFWMPFYGHLCYDSTVDD